jgi:hypothetical protein
MLLHFIIGYRTLWSIHLSALPFLIHEAVVRLLALIAFAHTVQVIAQPSSSSMICAFGKLLSLQCLYQFPRQSYHKYLYLFATNNMNSCSRLCKTYCGKMPHSNSDIIRHLKLLIFRFSTIAFSTLSGQMPRQSARTQAAGTKRKAGTKSTLTKTSSAAGSYTPEQVALFKSMQAEFNVQKKAAAAAQDEGTLLFYFDKAF